jgi:hypothetical protein
MNTWFLITCALGHPLVCNQQKRVCWQARVSCQVSSVVHEQSRHGRPICTVPSYSTSASTQYTGWSPLISQTLPRMLHRLPACKLVHMVANCRWWCSHEKVPSHPSPCSHTDIHTRHVMLLKRIAAIHHLQCPTDGSLHNKSATAFSTQCLQSGWHPTHSTFPCLP